MGLSSDKVELMPYSEKWAELFKKEKSFLENILDNNYKEIVHIGSTSIPQIICAKPIIDIAIGVEDYQKLEVVKELLLEHNYYHNSEAGDFDRLYFAKGEYDNRIYNIHVEILGGISWKRHILFRRLLIDKPEYLKEYCELKHKLAQCYSNDRSKYLEGKNIFIQKVVEEANNCKNL
jgi:UPF0157 protein yqkA